MPTHVVVIFVLAVFSSNKRIENLSKALERATFPSEYCTPVHNSLVNHVRGYNIRVVDVDIVSLYCPS